MTTTRHDQSTTEASAQGTDASADQTATPEDRALKARHRAVWAGGDYAAVAAQVIPSLGGVLVQACDVRAGQRVLDVAAGTGNAAIPAALAGAEVVATDLTPELLDLGRGLARSAGADLTWRTADAEALPFEDGTFDTVMSCVGVMFAPHHQQAADELVRVCRTGGRLGLLAWTPEGFIGQLFAAMRPFAPPPPPGAQAPPRWGDADHVTDLLGGRVEDVQTERRTLVVDTFAEPEDFQEFFATRYGPTIAVRRAVAEDPDRLAALDEALVDLARQHLRTDEDGRTVMGWEYLLLTARTRRG